MRVSTPAARPSDVGVDAAGIEALLDAAAHLELHSIAVARRGQVIARGWWDPYRADLRHLLHSVSKSITASVVGILVGDGVIGLDDPVLHHLPSTGRADVADVWRRVTVRHCLSMTVGHTEDAWRAENRRAPAGLELLDVVLDTPPDAEPGSVFAYNQVATYLLARAVAHRTGEPLQQVALERLLHPLGITDLSWYTDPGGNALGFSGAHLRTDDLLRLTRLWLEGGRVDGAPLVPADYLAQAARPALPPTDPDGVDDWGRGYGFSFWSARHGYRADGAFGQYGLVLPEQDLAVAVTSEIAEMGELLDLVWEHLLPAVGRTGSTAADDRLADRLASLALPALGTAGSPGPDAWGVAPAQDAPDGVVGVEYADDGGPALVLVRPDGRHRLALGDGSWATTTLTTPDGPLEVAASGGWGADGLRAEVRLVTTPHSLHVHAARPGDASVRWRMVPLHSRDPFGLAVRPVT